MSTIGAVAAGLGSAACFGAASAGQHLVASAGQGRSAVDPRLLISLARSRVWLTAGALELAAVGLQVLALRWGAVSMVQPLLVLGLPIAVLVAARLKRQQVGGGEWLGVALCALGVGTIAALLPGEPQRPDSTLRTFAALAGVLLGALLLGALLRSRAAAGAAAGVAAGVGAAALAICGPSLTAPGELLTDWPVYLAVAAGLLALQLGQAAFQDDRLGAPLTAATVAEPVAAIILSTLLLHETVAGDVLSRAGSGLAAVVAVVGVAVVVRHRPVDPA
ncbi:MAG: hypothetical protein QOK42_284 [Frankiaceae bacterium]|nr:hypothetical protein [Frankiaceae bacterium]